MHTYFYIFEFVYFYLLIINLTDTDLRLNNTELNEMYFWIQDVAVFGINPWNKSAKGFLPRLVK